MAETREQPASRARPMPERLAGAPISWGACEVPGWGRMPAAETVLAEMARLGLRGTELGPAGFLPAQPAALSALLRHHGLAFVGAFTPLVLHDADREATARLARDTIDLLSRAGGHVLVVAAVQDLAWSTPEPLDDDGWQRLAAAASEIEALAAEQGITFALHPHVGTVIETAEQVARALAETQVGWCLDTGHLLIGGTDPAAFASEHGERITHVHLKDVDAAVAAHRGFGLQRVYSEDRSLDETLSFGDRDCVLVPRGYHTVSAPPGYDLYYLNVMAGPARLWAVANDPDHEWILNK